MQDQEMHEHEYDGADEEQRLMDNAKIALCNTLIGEKDRAVSHKTEVEQRWMEDERQYWGYRLSPNAESDEGEEEEIPPVDNKTQPKVDAAAARIGDMMFPTNDRNFSMTNTPRPTDIDGNEIDPKRAKQAMKGMEEKIDDNLNESDYAKHGRSIIFDACKLGIGILKGPFTKSVTRRVVRREMEPVLDEEGNPIPEIDDLGQPIMGPDGMPQNQLTEAVRLSIVQDMKPSVCRVDPWMFFPLPCRSIEECPGAFELHLYSKQGLAELSQHPGFDSDPIRRVLRSDPVVTKAEASLLTERQQLLRSGTQPYKEYPVWEYHGAIDKKIMQEMGLDLGDDPLDVYSGEVWFCGNEILKLEANAMLGDLRVPYYVLAYKRDDADLLNSWGLCRIMRDPQRSIDIVYEAMHYNSMLCSGPQSIHFKGKAVPMDGKFSINGPKHWEVTDERCKSIDEVIQFRNIPSVIDQLIPMYELSKQNADENTALPPLAEGESSQVQQTLGEVSIIANAQNIIQRRLAHCYDDDVTIPMITRFYWWEMEFGDDDEIKVEMDVDPRGASYLMVKDMQTQHAMLAYQMYMQDPQLQQKVKADEMHDIIFSFLDVPTDRLFKTEEERQQEAQNNPQQQMQMRAAEAEIAKSEAEAQKAQAEAMKAQREAQQGSGEGEGQNLDILKERLQYELGMAEVEASLIKAQLERDGRMASAAAQQNVKLADLQAKMQTSEQDQQVKILLERLRASQRAQEQQSEQYFRGMDMSLKLKQARQRQENLDQGYDTFG